MHLDFAEQFARIGKAVASPQRIILLDLLAQGERPVDGLAQSAGLSVANTSQHLRTLLAAHLVTAQRRGLQVFYRLASPAVAAWFASIQIIAAEQLAEVASLAHQAFGQGHIEGVDYDELHRRVTSGEVVLIDVRPPEEYAAGHLPGAISVPLDKLLSRLRGVSQHSDIIAYCRGPYCGMAVAAVRELRDQGYRASCLADGPIQWALRSCRVVRDEPARAT